MSNIIHPDPYRERRGSRTDRSGGESVFLQAALQRRDEEHLAALNVAESVGRENPSLMEPLAPASTGHGAEVGKLVVPALATVTDITRALVKPAPDALDRKFAALGWSGADEPA